MREIQDTLSRWLAGGLPVALATVTRTWGSAPRGVGSRMAVTTDARMVGSVSGGCVESAIVEAAASTLAQGTFQRLSFGVSDETAWSVGLACGGQIEVVVERLDPAWFAFVAERLKADVPVASGLVVGKSPHAEAVGRRWTKGGDGAVLGELPADLLDAVRPAVEAALVHGQARTLTADTPAAQPAEVFIDALPPRPTLILVGGVHIAVALAELARGVGYRTVLVDPRAAFATAERFPHVDEILVRWPDEAFRALHVTPATAVAVLSHDPKIDDPAVRLALGTPAFYVGALGSRGTQAARRTRLLEQGMAAATLDRLHGPIGLPIGAQTPEEIALAVMAEVIAANRLPAAVPTGAREPATTPAPQPHVAAIVLAAGASRRMGTPKLGLPWRDTTVLGQVLAHVRASRAAQAVVVTGAEAAGVEAIAAAAGLPTVHNPDWEAGMMTSVQAGLRAMPPDVDAVLILLGDQPLIDATVIDAVIEGYEAGNATLVAPAYQGKRGHPVLFDRAHFAELLALPPDAVPRAVLERHPAATRLIAVPAEGIVVDLDEPADVARWMPPASSTGADAI